MSALLSQLEGRERRAECEKHEAPKTRPDADDQWFGDMMILQVLADSAQVNDQEREVLTRWIEASIPPSQRAASLATPE